MSASRPLEDLLRSLSSATEVDGDPAFFPRLSLVHAAGLVHVDFFGSPFDEAYGLLCDNLVLPEVAQILASVNLRAPDEGANGTCNWDLTLFAECDVKFPVLTHFSVQLNAPGDHNGKVIAADYEEAGTIGALLAKSPSLDTLIVPSAPDASFFLGQSHPLRYLSVDAGYGTQSFVGNLAASSRFPNLQSFEFGEYNQEYMQDFSASCTPFDDYKKLFTSAAFDAVRSFTWRNPVASPSEIRELRAIRPAKKLQFQVVRFSSMYVRTDGDA